MIEHFRRKYGQSASPSSTRTGHHGDGSRTSTGTTDTPLHLHPNQTADSSNPGSRLPDEFGGPTPGDAINVPLPPGDLR